MLKLRICKTLNLRKIRIYLTSKAKTYRSNDKKPAESDDKMRNSREKVHKREKGESKIGHLVNATKKKKTVIIHLYCISRLMLDLAMPSFTHL